DSSRQPLPMIIPIPPTNWNDAAGGPSGGDVGTTVINPPVRASCTRHSTHFEPLPRTIPRPDQQPQTRTSSTRAKSPPVGGVVDDPPAATDARLRHTSKSWMIPGPLMVTLLAGPGTPAIPAEPVPTAPLRSPRIECPLRSMVTPLPAILRQA